MSPKRVSTDCLSFEVYLCIQIKKTNFNKRKRHWDYIFGNLDIAAVQDCTKFPSLITNVILQLGRCIINGVCYQRYEKRLEKQKDRPIVNICAVEKALKRNYH